MEPFSFARSKQQIIDEYRECKVNVLFGPLFGLVIVVTIILLPAFIHEHENIKRVVLLVAGVYLLLYVVAIYKNSAKKMDLMFELLSTKDDK